MGILVTLKRALFRWRSDGTGPVRLGQRRIFILPSRGGLLFAATLAVMLTGAINYNLSLGHALVFFLAGLGIVGMIHAFRNLHGLIVTPGRSEPVFAGDTAHFQLTLDNDRSTPRLALELAAEVDKPVFAALPGNRTIKISLPLATQRRGWLALPRVRLASRYPLGLFTAWAYLQPSMRCLVYPAPIITPLPIRSPIAGGGEYQGEFGQEDFAGFRSRQPADSLRHVAWKASARRSGETPLLVKQFVGGEQSELIFDWSQTAPGQASDVRLGILAGWVLVANADGVRFGLRLPDVEIPPDLGETHRQRCLEALALCPT